MADCPYARCIQERRHIKRELLRWTKNMVYVVGLERVAEELMGRKRWKQYQDSLYSSSSSSSSSSSGGDLSAQQKQLQQGSQQQRLLNVGALGALNQAKLQAQLKQEPANLRKLANNHFSQDEQSVGEDEPCRIKLEVEASEVLFPNSTETAATTIPTCNNTSKRLREEDDEKHDPSTKQNGNSDSSDEHERRLKPKLETDKPVSPLRQNDHSSRQNDQVNDEDATKERTGEVASDRVQTTPGLLRVKKEEDLQDTTGVTNNTDSANARFALASKNSELTAAEINATVPSLAPLLTNRRASPPPEDWKPLDKCYFCLDGKLPHDDQAPLSPHSDSSGSWRSTESPMSVQVDPMAASVVAAALSGTYPTLLPQWCLPPREAPIGVQAHQDNATTDQPLDLSAKPKNSQDNNISLLEQQKIPLRMPTGIDPKSIFKLKRRKDRVSDVIVTTIRKYSSCYRTKPRLTGQGGVGGVPVVGAGGGRRTYTEEELQAALRDIQTGKLGTRRAAVIYGIPRSTLRNKVYKLAMEKERDASLSNAQAHDTALPSTTAITTASTNATTTTTAQNATQNSSATPPTQNDEVDEKELSGAEEEKEVEKALLKPLLSLEDLVRFSGLESSSGESLRTLLQRGQETGTEWPGFEHANIGPYIQKMLAAGPFKGLEMQDYRIPEVMRRLMSEDKRLSKEVNGERSGGSRAPMTNDDFNPVLEDEASDSAQGRAILKIPSYKPANTPGSSRNGGESFAAGFAAASPGLLERASPAFSGTSSPTNSLVGKAVNFRDVIAKSISVKFQEGQSNAIAGGTQSSAQGSINESNPFKRGRYTPPQGQQQQQPRPQNHDKQKPATGGKGTRPKRGKYRNYDRDSLVEAVRAVQRGEMSVHRAGSYYGVPHSTLEYKVKERHLMRPRKRDQKQPDDKAKEASSTTSAASTSASIRPGSSEKKVPPKPQKPFASSTGLPGPSGMKMPAFMEGMPHLPFGHPFNFWGPSPFMPSPFIAGAPPNVPGILPEQYFASQRMRGLQEQQRNAIMQQQRERADGAATMDPITSNNRTAAGAKAGRDASETAYENATANGSFLDNLIRSSLESGINREQRAVAQQPGPAHLADSLSNKALIDQLCRNSRRTPLPRMTQDSSEDESYRSSSGSRAPERPERVPTVELSPSPSDRGRSNADDTGSERLASPASPSSREENAPEAINGAQDQAERKPNHYPDIHNLYAVSTDKKSACDSKLIVNHSSQKTTQQKEYVSGLVVQLQQRQATPTSAPSANNNNANNQQEQRVFPKEEPVE